jgi:hypothetical protein
MCNTSHTLYTYARESSYKITLVALCVRFHLFFHAIQYCLESWTCVSNHMCREMCGAF